MPEPARVQLVTHPDCLRHDTGPGHPERAARLEAVLAALSDAFPDLVPVEAPAATRDQLERVHSPAHVASILDAKRDAPVALDPDTILSPGSARAALRGAGAGVAAVDAAMAGRAPRAFCAVRPPGHHAVRETAMGFCLFNNVAVAAAHALAAHGLSRVAIADFDVHHGNGTQAIFAREPRVCFASSQQLPLYPGSGHADERGVGNVFNAPLPPGAGGDAFRAAWDEVLLPALDRFAPEFVFVSAGFDGHRDDPLAGLALDAGDYAWVTGELVALAGRHAGGRIVSFLEGGYDLGALRTCSVAHVGALRDWPPGAARGSGVDRDEVQ
jgi:acetoin utilization deacetylase AcuC-like enzyme